MTANPARDICNSASEVEILHPLIGQNDDALGDFFKVGRENRLIPYRTVESLF